MLGNCPPPLLIKKSIFPKFLSSRILVTVDLKYQKKTFIEFEIPSLNTKFEVFIHYVYAITFCSPNPITNSKTTKMNVFDQSQQVLHPFHQKQSDWFTKTWKFRIRRFGIDCLIRWISDNSWILQAFRPEFRSEKQTNLADHRSVNSSHNSAIKIVWFSDRNSSRNSRRILLSSSNYWAFVWLVSTSLAGILQMTTEFFNNSKSDQNSVGILIRKTDSFS